jgi:hypothetical protein
MIRTHPQRARQDAELATENEDLKLEGRSATERHQNDARNALSARTGENRRKIHNAHTLTQFGICERPIASNLDLELDRSLLRR